MPRSVNDRLAQLTPQQRAALLRELRANREPRQDTDRIARAGRTEPLPLSFVQQSLWFLDQWSDGLAFYNTPLALRMRGPLDTDLLRAALTTVTARHETLRTRYLATPDGPRQIIDAPAAATLEVLDLSALPGDERAARTERIATEEARRRIDLSAGPLLRATLAKQAEDEHVLVLSMHHIATDGWSTTRMVQELSECYLAGRAGRAPNLPDLPVQYADYAVWQRERLAGEAGARSLDYWRGQLDGLSALQFPGDRPRPADPLWTGAEARAHLEPALHRDLNELARRERTRLLPVAVAGLAALMSRYTGQDDITLGSVFSGRTRTEFEPLIGYFANTVVLRTSTAGDPTFRELLARTNEVVFDAHKHQELPFDQLVGELRPERDQSRNPLFQHAIYQLGTPVETVRMGEIELTGLPLHMGTTKFDWTIGISERSAGGVDLMAEYATELFDGDRIERLLGHYRRVLETAVSRPDTRLGELAVLTPAEHERILVRWNDTAVAVDTEGGVPAAFAAQVARTPHAPAVAHRDVELDYAALDRRANRIAHRLRALGAGPGTLVGVCLGRTHDMPAGLLGVLKSGAAFVPLDPDYPATRLAHVLADARPAAVLVDAHSTARLTAAAELADGADGADGAGGVAAVLLDLSADTLDDVPDTAPDIAVRPHDLAYVTYTSGSTGKPKGVMVEHAQLLNLFKGLDDRVGEHSPGTWLAISSISFDMSEVEMFWTLTRGFKVVVASGRPHELLRSAPRKRTRPMEFGLFYFASDAGDSAPGADRYRLLIEGAKFADRHGFSAVWTPERHFHEFGGLYPAPSVTSAAIAMVTENIAIRSGSVVMPLHHPVRVAEEWAVVDNLSGGRVGMAFASGWLHDDFVFAPQNYEDRKQVMIDGVATVRSLWRGESATLTAGNGKDVEFRIRPRPVQSELPVWLSSGGTPATFKAAAEQGANILTHLLGQDLDQLAESIRLYHDTWREKFGSEGGKVTLMLHTFLDEDRERALELVREPFIGYLRTSLDLVRVLGQRMGVDIDPRNIGEEDLDALLNHAFDRYVHTSGLFGTPEDCRELIDSLSAIGVDELACLVDFGIDTDDVLNGLVHLDRLRQLTNAPDGPDDVPDDAHHASLAELIDRHGVTHLQCTPSLAQLMLDDPSGDARRALGALDVLLVGGEAVPTALALRLREATGASFHNMYGPTETTVWSTGAVIDGSDTGAPTVPVGAPIANTSVYVLDAHGRPLPVGVPGELYIGGAGVSRGYHNRPDLTRERFLPDPFRTGQVSGARMYRTGDLAKWLPDGRLEFLGRGDDQVKVRGYRVELGEVETALRDHPGVGACVVAARGPVGAQYLAAYLVAAPGHGAPGGEELRAHLRERLPEFMVPARYVALDELPLNANGKVDRFKLPDPAASAASGPAQAPVTPTQRILAEVWEQLLEVRRIGIHDNFFDLGGHSITVIRAVDFANKRGVRITARQLFQHQTIAELAEIADRETDPALASAPTSASPSASAESGTVTVLKAGGSRPPLFCLHSSTGTSASYFPLARHFDEDRPLYGIDAAPIVPGAPEESLDELAERYRAAIREVQPEGPYHLLGWSLGGGIAWAVAGLLQAEGAEIALLTLLDTQPPAELAEPLGHTESVCAFADSFALSMGRPPLAVDLAEVRPLPVEEQYAAVLERLTAAGLVRDGEHADILARARMFTAMTRAASTWRATPYRGPVELLVADDPGDVDWFRQGWERHSAGPVHTRLVPGTHFSVMQTAAAPELALILGELLSGSRVG